MDKRGEVYLLAVLVLAVIVGSFATTINYIRQENMNGNFEKISQNYELESNMLINSLLITENIAINDAFNNFTIIFTAYSKSQNPSYGTVYVLGFRDQDGSKKIQIGNYLNKPLLVDTDGNYQTQEYGSIQGCFDEIPIILDFKGLSINSDLNLRSIDDCTKIIDFEDDIVIGIRDNEGEITCDDEDIIWYHMQVTEDKPQIMIINHFEKGRQRKVYIGGEGFIPSTPFEDGGDDECGLCERKVIKLTLQYNGGETAQVMVKQKKDGKIAFDDELDPEEPFTFIGQDKKGTLTTEIMIYINGNLHTSMHTSCSKPIGPGLVSGDFEVISGESGKGGPLCPI